MADERRIRLEDREGVMVLTFDRPPVNAMDAASAEALRSAFTEIDAAPPGRALVITGAGKAFSAGLDLKVVPRYSREQQREMVSTINATMAALYRMARPTVAALNGHAMAGGLVLALACDYRIATTTPCKLGLTEVNVGVPYPAVALLVTREELPAHTARVLALTGKTFAPDEALRMGIVDELAPPAELLARAIEQGRRLGAFAAYGRIKAQFRARAYAEVAEILEKGSDPMLERWIDRLSS
jgi:enoyl-CoA hydratase